MSPEPLFSLDASLLIAVILGVLVLMAGVFVWAQFGCAHEWVRRYDVAHKRAYLSCLRCNAKTAGWQYGQRQHNGKDAA